MNFAKRIFSISNEKEFHSVSMAQFHYQKKHNPVYASYLEFIGFGGVPKHYTQIPFLPIQFFKTHKITTQFFFEKVFESSGTSNSTQSSKHFVCDLGLYRQSARLNFTQQFGSLKDFVVLALLPSYLERSRSSLVEMVAYFMQLSNKKENGFFLYNYLELNRLLLKLEKEKKKIVLFGVAFALLDFFAEFPMQLQNTILIETGGMKGRKKEITKTQLHDELKKQSGLTQIYSEYGMTELLSQSYTQGDTYFVSPCWMKILIRDPNDPFSMLPHQNSGGINLIDLANIYSCPFIATDDLGKKINENTFEVLGRFDESDIRGCSLMVGL